jgi:hypothetical protein
VSQKKLSPRQARWLDQLSEFDYEIIYVPGVDNTLADVLSHIYSEEPVGTVQAASEYVSVDDENTPRTFLLNFVTSPLYMGPPLFLGATEARKSSCLAIKCAALLPPAPPRPRPPQRPRKGNTTPTANDPNAASNSPPTPLAVPETPESVNTPVADSLETSHPSVADATQTQRPSPPARVNRKVILKLGRTPSQSLEGGSISSPIQQRKNSPTPGIHAEGERTSVQTQDTSDMGNCNSNTSTTYNNENTTRDAVNDEDPQSHMTPNVSNPPNKAIVLGDVASEILSESPPKTH